MDQARGQLGDVVKDEGVLPDHNGIHEAAHAEGIVAQEPEGVVRPDQDLEHHRHIDIVAQVQHEQLGPVSHILKISRKGQRETVAKVVCQELAPK